MGGKVMSINNLKVLHNQVEKEMPNWITFANTLGEYLYDHGCHYNTSSKIVISLPTQQYFSLFVAMGIANKKFSINKQTRSIQKTFLIWNLVKELYILIRIKLERCLY